MAFEISVLGTLPVEFDGDLLIVPTFEDSEHIDTSGEEINKALDGILNSMKASQEIKGKFGELTVVYTFNKIASKRVLVVGLGKKEELDLTQFQRAYAKAAKEAEKLGANKVGVCVPKEVSLSIEQRAQGITEAFILGNYKFNRFKSKKPEQEIESLVLIDSAATDKVGKGVKQGQILSLSQNYARDLANTPSNFLTPTDLAEEAKIVANTYGLHYTMLDESDMRELGMNALLGVGKGSAEPSKLIIIEYKGNPSSETVLTLVGKGVTFDTGGISIKPSQNMHEMKGDMGGAAAVLGAMRAIGEIKPKVNVTMVIGAVENMPSGTAQKPGDVVYSMSGKTIEILNTDAEGRLVLSDAITYAKQKLGATHIVDVATLTGACLVALGTITTGVITNNDDFYNQVNSASQKTGEKIWKLPNFPEYRKLLDSSVADIANIGGRNAGTITAGIFIGEFVEDTPWVHLDIAGTATITDNGDALNPKGETGSMVRTLATLAMNFKEK